MSVSSWNTGNRSFFFREKRRTPTRDKSFRNSFISEMLPVNRSGTGTSVCSTMKEKIEALRGRKAEMETELNKSLAELEKQIEMEEQEQIKGNVAGTERALDLKTCQKRRVKTRLRELVGIVIERTSASREIQFRRYGGGSPGYA